MRNCVVSMNSGFCCKRFATTHDFYSRQEETKERPFVRQGLGFADCFVCGILVRVTEKMRLWRLFVKRANQKDKKRWGEELERSSATKKGRLRVLLYP